MAAEERVEKEEIEIYLGGENPNTNIERSGFPSTSSSSATIFDFKWESNKMVKSELEAARVLADLAELATLERENYSGTSSSKWGNKGTRSKKRVKNEMTMVDSGNNLECSKQDLSVETQPSDRKLFHAEEVQVIKAEQDQMLLSANNIGARKCASLGGGRSKQHLSEAEKEARRLRRVLANRESARQTIRRRQAIFEDLTRKAAELALDNERMKKELEVIMKKCQSLKDTNKQLKAQVVALTKTDTGITPSPMVKTPASTSGNLQLPEQERSQFAPFIWPSIVQPLNPVQKQPISQKAVTLQDQGPVTGKRYLVHDYGNPSSADGPNPPFRIFPYPWFFPPPDHENKLVQPQELCGFGDIKDDNFISKSHDTTLSLKPMGIVENHHQPSIYKKLKTEPSNSTETTSSNNFPVSSLKLSVNGGSHPKKRPLILAPLKSVEPETTVKIEIGLLKESNSRAESVFKTDSHISGTSPETMPGTSTNANKKLSDAAEARKRRKELTKLKSHHSRQLRLQS